MDQSREIRHLIEQVGDMLRRLKDQPALQARQGRRRPHRMVRLTATLTAGGKGACKVQKLAYNTIPTPTSATWGDLSPSQTLTVFDTVMIEAGLSGSTFPSGTLARIEQDPYSGIWYFSDFYACQT